MEAQFTKTFCNMTVLMVSLEINFDSLKNSGISNSKTSLDGKLRDNED